MELSQLEYFRTVARTEHITRAAEELHLTQPALSRAIARLETEVGARLFEREGNRIRLNRMGRAFLARVERALLELNDGMNELADLGSMTRGSLSISSSTSGFLSEPLGRFLKENPGVHLKQYIQNPEQMAASLERGEADFAVSLAPVESSSILWEPLLEEETLVLVPQGHPLAERGEISLSELAGERFIFNSSSFGIRETICDYCLAQGFAPDIFYEGGEDEMAGMLAEAGLGVLFVTSMSHLWQRSEPGSRPSHALVSLRVSDPIRRRTIGIATLRGHYLSRAAQRLYEELVEYFRVS